MLKVVLADDEYFIRNALKSNIPWQENGFAVVGDANNGKTAYQLIMEHRPHIAVIDINMPGYSGLELIERLTREQINCKYIILTGYDEFKYAQKAIHLGIKDYILKPVDYQGFVDSLNEIKLEILEQSELNSKLISLEQQNREMMIDHYYNDLVNCNLTAHGVDQYDDLLARELLPDYSQYAVFVAEFHHEPGKPQLKDLRRQIAREIPGVSFTICIDMKNRLFFICEAEIEEQFTQFLTRIQGSIEDAGYEITIGVGSRYNNFDQLYLSYNEACIALQNASLTEENVIEYKEISANQNISLLDTQLKNTLKTMVIQKNTEDIQNILHLFYQQHMRSRTFFDIVILQTLELISLLIDILSAQTSQPVSLLNLDSSILDTLTGMRSIAEISEWVENLYGTAIEKMSAVSAEYSSATLSVESYIREHLGDPELSITKISRNLYLNYSYICYCFKRDKNMTINDYINKLRIEEAISLFKKGYDNVSFVAEKCGFNNSGYFSKRFKKATGLTPSDYLRTLDY